MLFRIWYRIAALLLSLATSVVPEVTPPLDDWRQSMKVVEEATEHRDAIAHSDARFRVNEEAVDVFVAVCQYLRRQPLGTRCEAFRCVMLKNRVRGYW